MALDTLKIIVQNFQEQFGFAMIVVGYAIVSLVVALVLFTVIRSTAKAVGEPSGSNLKVELGGGIAGFFVILALLLWIHTNYVPAPIGTVEISGNVFWKDNETPVEGASVSIDGANIAPDRTNAEGLFRMGAPRTELQPKFTVRARFGDASDRLTDVDRNKARALRVLLPRPPGSSPAAQKKKELLLAFAEDVTLFMNTASWTDEVARQLEQLRARKASRQDIAGKEAQFNQLRSDTGKLFSRIKKEYEDIRLTYTSEGVVTALQEFGAWWDTIAKTEGHVGNSPDSEGQKRLRVLLDAMRQEQAK